MYLGDFERTNFKEKMTKTDNLDTKGYYIVTVDLRDPKWDSCIKCKDQE